MTEIKESAIVVMLDRLAELRAEAEAVRLRKEAERDKILAPLKPTLLAIDAQFQPDELRVQESIEAVSQAITQAVLVSQFSVKGERLQAVYTRARVSWDTPGLERLMATDENAARALLPFRRVGQPSVSFRNR